MKKVKMTIQRVRCLTAVEPQYRIKSINGAASITMCLAGAKQDETVYAGDNINQRQADFISKSLTRVELTVLAPSE